MPTVAAWAKAAALEVACLEHGLPAVVCAHQMLLSYCWHRWPQMPQDLQRRACWQLPSGVEAAE